MEFLHTKSNCGPAKSPRCEKMEFIFTIEKRANQTVKNENNFFENFWSNFRFLPLFSQFENIYAMYWHMLVYTELRHVSRIQEQYWPSLN